MTEFDYKAQGLSLNLVIKDYIGRANQIAWSSDYRMIAISSMNNQVYIKNAFTGKNWKVFRFSSSATCLDWNHSGDLLAIGFADGSIRICDTNDLKKQSKSLKGQKSAITNIAWSPTGRYLSSCSYGTQPIIWDVHRKTKQSIDEWVNQDNKSFWYSINELFVTNILWLVDDSRFVYTDIDSNVGFIVQGVGLLNKDIYGNTSKGVVVNIFQSKVHEFLFYSNIPLARDKNNRNSYKHSGPWPREKPENLPIKYFQKNISFCFKRNIVAVGTQDRTIRLYNCDNGKLTDVLEGHTSSISTVSFSHNGDFLATKSIDGTTRIWNCITWDTVIIINDYSSETPGSCVDFHNKQPLLAISDLADRVIRIWEVDFEKLRELKSLNKSVKYTNAKIVLLGDTGVGKSGLALALTNQPFVPTESTHGRHIWMFDTNELSQIEDNKEIRETLLWDLAGQPGYRLIHQLHLDETAVALVVFDGRNEIDPFRGVRHWERALRQIQRLHNNKNMTIKKFLVAARVDRGGIGVSQERIDELMVSGGFDGYFATSAKEGTYISDLRNSIIRSISWNEIPKVSSTELFQSIKSFLIEEKESGCIIASADELYRHFVKNSKEFYGKTNNFAQFDTCIARMESSGLIRRLSFADLILLQPELLDSYASALIDAAKEEPDGLGSISEEVVRSGNFYIADDERIPNEAQERLLLTATIEDLLRYELALRESSDYGTYLIFPSQLTRESPDLPEPQGKTIKFIFEGPILNIYAALVVRLCHSGAFKKNQLWKNAAIFNSTVGGVCGLYLEYMEEGKSNLILFFDEDTSEETRFQFDEYIYLHLHRKSVTGSVHRQRLFICNDCETPITDIQVNRRRDKGFDWISCNVCENRISLLDQHERLRKTVQHSIEQMDKSANDVRNREVRSTSIIRNEEEIQIKSMITNLQDLRSINFIMGEKDIQIESMIDNFQQGEPSMTDTVALSVLLKGIDFLFGEASKLMQERREARQKRGEEDVASVPNTTESVTSSEVKATVQSKDIKQVYLNDVTKDIKHYINQIEAYRENKRIAEQAIQRYGSFIDAPSKVRHDLKDAEDGIKEYVQRLKNIIENTYGHKINIIGLD